MNKDEENFSRHLKKTLNGCILYSNVIEKHNNKKKVRK